MEKELKNDEKFEVNSYIQFGTYSISFLGTVIVGYIYDHIKHSESESAEA